MFHISHRSVVPLFDCQQNNTKRAVKREMQIRLILLVPRLIDRKSLTQINLELLVSKAFK